MKYIILVERPAKLRIEPNNNKPAVTVLYPNQILKLIELKLIDMRAEWIYVK